MIFVTVGTHEQQFNRLVKYMDKWAMQHDEEVIIQTGYSTYEPKHCKWQKIFPYQEMSKKVAEARIIITHAKCLWPLIEQQAEIYYYLNNKKAKFRRFLHRCFGLKIGELFFRALASSKAKLKELLKV